jgi:PPOX class probable F420-dependent enzyme
MKLDPDVRALLDQPLSADLATLNADGSPQLSIVWHERRGDEVVINTTAQRVKARNMDRDPRVALLVGDPARYARLDGVASVVATGAQALADIRALAVRYEGEEHAERETRDVWSKQDRVTYSIAIKRVYRYGFD